MEHTTRAATAGLRIGGKNKGKKDFAELRGRERVGSDFFFFFENLTSHSASSVQKFSVCEANLSSSLLEGPKKEKKGRSKGRSKKKRAVKEEKGAVKEEKKNGKTMERSLCSFCDGDTRRSTGNAQRGRGRDNGPEV
jgi:hypothetical protein